LNNDYILLPFSASELRDLSDEDLSKIPEFTIRNDFGQIKWNGLTDVRNLNLDEIVTISELCSEVYPSNVVKPPEVSFKFGSFIFFRFFSVPFLVGGRCLFSDRV
jgi:hypothetical protein